ncbi:MAG: hypothetical protein L0H94_02480 [Nitrospira sp.]|nr:hypothetical protein [Nitrospira sp.]
MSSSPHVPYVEIHVPIAYSEQEFLRHAVQAAVNKYRELHPQVGPPQATCDEVL